MERLTVDTKMLFCDISQCRETPGGSFCEDGYCDQRRVYERLREYERLGAIDDLTALIKARKEGLVVVLPCKIDTPVWYIDERVEPRECGLPTCAVRKRVKKIKFYYGMLDWIDTPIYLTRAEADAAMGGDWL